MVRVHPAVPGWLRKLLPTIVRRLSAPRCLTDRVVTAMRLPRFVVATTALRLRSIRAAQRFAPLEHRRDVHALGGFSARNIDLAAAKRGRLAWAHTFRAALDNAIYQAAAAEAMPI